MKRSATLVEALEDVLTDERGITFIRSRTEEKFVSYNELYGKALSVLCELKSRGLKEGDELILQIEDNEQLLYVFWACLFGGILPVPLTVASRDEHIGKLLRVFERLNNPYLMISRRAFFLLDRLASRTHLASALSAVKIKSILLEDMKDDGSKTAIRRPNPKDIAFVQFSSGTTGDPKGIVLTHENLLTNIYSIREGAELTLADSSLNWVPLTHDMGLIGFHLTPLSGGAIQYHVPTGMFVLHPDLWLEKVSEHQVTVIGSPNFGYKLFLERFQAEAMTKLDLSGVRLIFNGAEPISNRLCNEFLDKMERYGLKRNAMFPVYGLAEASLAVTFPECERELRSVVVERRSLKMGERIDYGDASNNDGVNLIDLGKPVEGTSVRVLDDDGRIVPDEHVGRIEIRGKNVTRGFYNDPEATEAAISRDGWLKTGDLGFLRKGHLFVTGREKDIIFSNGQNYYAPDIERVAEAVEGVVFERVAACGLFNEQTGQDEVVLFLVYRKRLEEFLCFEKQLRRVIRERMGLKIDRLIPVNRIRKTTSGKKQRYKLRLDYAEGRYDSLIEKLDKLREESTAAEITLPTNDTERRLVEVWEEVLEVERIGVDDNFFDLGGDSITMVRIVAKVAERLGVRVSYRDFLVASTIGGLAERIGRGEAGVEATVYPKVEPDVERIGEPFPADGSADGLFVGSGECVRNGGILTHGYYEIETQVDLARLNRSLQQVIEHQPMLRAVVLRTGEQRILEEVGGYRIEEEDLRGLGGQERRVRIERERERMSHYIFDPEHWPLFEIKAFRIGEETYYFCVGFDLLVVDGTSMRILARELAEYYSKPHRELPPLEFSLSGLCIGV